MRYCDLEDGMEGVRHVVPGCRADDGAVLERQALVVRLSEEARLRTQLQVRVIESMDCLR